VLESATLSPALIEAVHQLQAASGETVSLTSPEDLGLEVLHVVGPDVGIRLVVKVGGRMPLWSTAIGTAYLTTVADATIRSMYRRTEARGTAPSVALRTVLAAVRRARECQGKAYAEGAAVPDVAALSAPLPDGVAPRQLIVSIGGPVQRMRAQRAAIEQELDAWLVRTASLAPRATPPAGPFHVATHSRRQVG
jgi:DNA-binding IclR family transcriptional regulator